jgi:hypothetical protein
MKSKGDFTISLKKTTSFKEIIISLDVGMLRTCKNMINYYDIKMGLGLRLTPTKWRKPQNSSFSL